MWLKWRSPIGQLAKGPRKSFDFHHAHIITNQYFRCKEKIEKDVIRIGTKNLTPGFESVSWNHLTCFVLPKKTNPGDCNIAPCLCLINYQYIVFSVYRRVSGSISWSAWTKCSTTIISNRQNHRRSIGHNFHQKEIVRRRKNPWI